jgi:acetolactate decarboxylase
MKPLPFMKIKLLITLGFLLLMKNLTLLSQTPCHDFTITGDLKSVMKKGFLHGNIYIDTINKDHLYGMGPIAYLKGEITILNGTSYISTITDDSMMKIVETFDVRAPFLGYAHIANWDTLAIPDSVVTLKQLEVYLERLTQEADCPFFFQIKGVVAKALIHVVNLPEGSIIRSHDDAQSGKKSDYIIDKEVDILGFFSKNHTSVFTHHDSFLHMHLITKDLQHMGHIDDLILRKGGHTLLLPKE